MVKIHDDDNGSYACNNAVSTIQEHMTLVQEKITCINCMKLTIKEWERQVSEFHGQPRINAVNGLKMAKKQLKKLNTPSQTKR